MSKVVIIDVELGIDLDQLIFESAKDLTTSAKTELDGVLSAAKAVQEIKQQKSDNKERVSNDVNNIILDAYNKLEQAGSNGLPVDAIMSSVSPTIPNSSAFALRMKKVLSIKGNPYRLIRASIDGKPHYIFTQFNNIKSENV